MTISQGRFNYVAELIEGALSGSRTAQGKFKDEIINVQESHSTSDFGDLPTIIKQITAQEFANRYADYAPVRGEFTREYKVNDLRPSAFYSFLPDYSNLPEANGGKDLVPGGLPRIPELTEYPTFSYQASGESFGIAKYGARVNFSFEALLNDDWGVLESLPQNLAILARNQEDIVATEVLASATGPNPAFFDASNTLTGNPALSLESVAEGIQDINSRTLNGTPVQVGELALVVPPALEMEARRITGIGSYEVTDGSKTFVVTNPIAGLKVIVNKWLPLIDQSANKDTTWYLVPYKAAGLRPSVLFAPLRGREVPELRIANATGNYLGGGEVPGREGSFLNDDIEFRIRHYFGAVGIAGETVLASNGSNA